jgi:YjbE family integral membrane protein
VAIVTLLLRVPLLQLAGGLLLLWIAVRLVRPEDMDEAGARHGSSVWEAVWIIIVADITMSLDNVLAIAAAARGEMLLVIVGIALSLPIVIWGAGLLARLMNRWAWIVWLGGGFLAYVAVEMAFDDKAIHGWLGDAGDGLKLPVAIAVGTLVAVLGWWLSRRPHAAVPEDV